MADVLLARDLPEHQARLAEHQKANRRRNQVEASSDKASTKFEDLTAQDNDDLLKVLLLKNDLIAAD